MPMLLEDLAEETSATRRPEWQLPRTRISKGFHSQNHFAPDERYVPVD